MHSKTATKESEAEGKPRFQDLEDERRGRMEDHVDSLYGLIEAAFLLMLSTSYATFTRARAHTHTHTYTLSSLLLAWKVIAETDLQEIGLEKFDLG
jgi:hypothetical protein